MSSPSDMRAGVRVLHLTHSLQIGGKERVLLSLAQAGRLAGHDDRVLTFDRPYLLGDCELEAGDVPVSFVPRRQGIDLHYGRRLREFLDSHAVQVVHAHNHSALFLAALALGPRHAGRPVLVATWHNRPTFPNWRARLAVRWAGVRADHQVCVSSELRSSLLAMGWIKRGAVLRNGVDLTRFRPHGPVRNLRAEFGFAKSALLVGMLSRFGAGKLQRDLLQACRSMRSAGHDIAVVFAGDGPGMEACRGMVAPGDAVGFIPQVRDVAAFLRGLDVFALVSEHEGLPMSLLEAMACGLPVVASRVGGVPELVSPGTGILIRSGDSAALADALVTLKDESIRRPMGAAAHEHVAGTFALVQTVRDYDQLYQGADA